MNIPTESGSLSECVRPSSPKDGGGDTGTHQGHESGLRND